MKKDLINKTLIITAGIILINTINIFAVDGGKWNKREWKRILDLRGQWKFEIGDDIDWSKPEYDDGKWETIFVPTEWENEGFPGYDGYAWYRRTFSAEDLIDRDNLYLKMGYIDDCDEVYINGHMVGHQGWFPPDYVTSYQNERTYYILEEYLNPEGINTIAVRVYDSEMAGGIVRGDIGFFTKYSFLSPQIDLSGSWKFKIGDEMEWKEENYKDSNWNEVFVPAFWSQYGFKEFDGFGWYRKEFKIPAKFKDERLILLLGKIDDMDEVYLNGKKVGHTGRMYSNPRRNEANGKDYIVDRAYTIPTSYFNENGINVLAVRTYDGWLYGGIYDGPIGLVTREQYREWQRDYGSNKHIKNIFELFFGE